MRVRSPGPRQASNPACPSGASLLPPDREVLKALDSSVLVPNRGCLPDAGRRVVALYTAWGKPEEAAEWSRAGSLSRRRPGVVIVTG
jgi:hypothetical protein